jgi:hypothetical protein
MSEERADATEVAGAQSGTQRVVLRGVRALVLDDMPASRQHAVLEAAHQDTVEAWVPMAMRPGTVEAAVKAYAGPSGTPGGWPGTYKAVPYTSWYTPPLVIEPPLG